MLFALKHEDTRLDILHEALKQVPADELVRSLAAPGRLTAPGCLYLGKGQRASAAAAVGYPNGADLLLLTAPPQQIDRIEAVVAECLYARG